MRIIPEGGGLKAMVSPIASWVLLRMEWTSSWLSSFPAGEYGYLKGTVKSIGADALESTDQRPLIASALIPFR